MSKAALVQRNIPALTYRKEKGKRQTFLSSIFISVSVYLILLITVSLVFCFYLAGQDDPLSLIFIMSMTASAISSFAGGFFLCRLWGKGAFASALIFIGITLAISLLIALISKSPMEFSRAMLSKLPSVISAFLGSFIGKIKKKSSPYDKYAR